MTTLDRELLIEGVLEAWRTHNGINLYQLDLMPDEGLDALTLLKNGQPSKGRSVRRVIMHMQEVRAAHLRRGFKAGVLVFEKESSPSRDELRAALEASGEATADLLGAALRGDERVTNPRRAGMLLLGYLISHESHHRGQIMLALKQTGVRLPDEVRFGMWERWLAPARKTP